MENNKLQIVGEQGEIREADVLLHYKNNANNQEYILYTFHELDEQSMETIHASKVVLDGDNYKLEKIPDSEWNEVKDVMREIIKNEEGR